MFRSPSHVSKHSTGGRVGSERAKRPSTMALPPANEPTSTTNRMRPCSIAFTRPRIAGVSCVHLYELLAVLPYGLA